MSGSTDRPRIPYRKKQGRCQVFFDALKTTRAKMSKAAKRAGLTRQKWLESIVAEALKKESESG